jgi:glycosyltransferase involved in cell wall biosynthesis
MLVDPTPLEMARGMCALLDDKELREKISLAAQQRIRKQFCAELLDSKLSEFYQELAVSLGVRS